jgi:hypothetical protein
MVVVEMVRKGDKRSREEDECTALASTFWAETGRKLSKRKDAGCEGCQKIR